MCYIELNVYRHPSGRTLDPQRGIESLKLHFPEAEVLLGEQYALRIQRAEERGGPARFLDAERRDAARLGPAYAFRFPQQELRGTIKRHLATFIFQNDPTPELKDRIVRFLREITPEGIVVPIFEGCVGNRKVQIG